MKKCVLLALVLLMCGATLSGQVTITLPKNQNSFIVAPAAKGDTYLQLPITQLNRFWESETGNAENVLNNKDPWVAEIIWQDFDIKGVGKVLTITKGKGTGPDEFIGLTLKNYPKDQWGNAVVGVKRADAGGQPTGEYLWSWHIWVTDFTPDKAVTYPSGVVGMDRNLGAKDKTPGSVGSFGLLYQWGRKDPFPGAAKLTGNKRVATSLDLWPVEEPETGGNFAFAVQHPTTFIKTILESSSVVVHNGGKKNNYGDWMVTPNRTATWHNDAKSVHDPCPKGWRVPVAIVIDDKKTSPWADLGYDTTMAYDADNKGALYGGKDWWPMPGRLNETGQLDRVGERMYGLSSVPSTIKDKKTEFVKQMVRIILIRPEKAGIQLWNTEAIARGDAGSVRCTRCEEDDN